MVKKQYNVSLDEDVVDKIKFIFDKRGMKLSPVINQFLIHLIEEEENVDAVGS